MQIDYDIEADTMYIQLRDDEVDDTLEINPYIWVDVDKAGIPLGIEILFTKQVMEQLDLSNLTVHTKSATEFVVST